MTFRPILVGMVLVLSSGSATALKLPKEVTPAIRKACETDVRRLCVRKGSTIASVKQCVINNFAKLNSRCKYRLVRAGF